MSVDITIIKRDGRREPLDITKIQKMTSEAVADLSGVSQSEIELDAHIKFIDGMKSSDIQDALIKTAVEKIDIDVPNWTFVAARLRLYDLYHEVGKVLGNVKGNSYGPLQTTINYGIAQNRYKKDLCNDFDVEDLSNYIKPERDLQFTYLGIKTAVDKYLTRDALGQTFELPQHMFMMIAMFLASKENPKDKQQKAKDFYDVISTFEVMIATPTLSGARKIRSQLSSCFKKGTKIQTINDEINIENLVIGDSVLTDIGTYEKVEELFDRYYSGLLYSLEICGLNKNIQATEEHPIKAFKNKEISCFRGTKNKRQGLCIGRQGKKDQCFKKERNYSNDCIDLNKKFEPEWIQICNLEPKDFVNISFPTFQHNLNKFYINDLIGIKNMDEIDGKLIIKNETSSTRSFKPVTNQIANVINNEIIIDKDFMLMVGYFLAEGHISKDLSNICFTFSINETSYQQFIIDYFTRAFGIVPYLQVNRDNSTNVIISSKIIATLMYEICGTGFNTKYLKDIVMFADPEIQKYLLVGVIRGDGCAISNGYQLVLSNDKLINQLFQISLRCGLSPHMYNPHINPLSTTQCYTIVYNHIDKDFINLVDKNTHKINFLSKPQLNNRFWYNNEYYMEIKNVSTEEFEGNVYNIEVSNTHSYVVNNISVHNCFIGSTPDNIEGIFDSYKEMGLLSKFGGGIGWDWNKVRARSSVIDNNINAAGGTTPWLKITNDIAIAVDQLGVRKGAIAVYLEPWHMDIKEFLDLKKNSGEERMRTHDIFPALWISDLFMERVKNNSDWTLFDPYETQDLSELSGDAFKERYTIYENDPKIKKETIKAKDLWKQVLTNYFESGNPFLCFKDTANKVNPNKHVGHIRSSNLCTEIFQNTNPNHYAIKVWIDEDRYFIVEENELVLLNNKYLDDPYVLGKHLTVGDKVRGIVIGQDDEAKTFDVQLLDEEYQQPIFALEKECTDGETAVCNLASINLSRINTKEDIERVTPIAINMLDNVVDLNFYPTIKAKKTNLKSRAIGLGVMGEAEMLACKSILFGSEEHLYEINKIMECVSFNAIKASSKIAEEKDSYPNFNGSEWSKGLLPIDFANEKAKELTPLAESVYTEEEYKELREQVSKGMRNGYLMAIAPTSSISILVGTTQAIEPIYRKKWFEENLSGLIPVVAPKLSPETWEYYPSAFDVEQLNIIKAASVRQKWIDQGQSTNIFMRSDKASGRYLNEIYMTAWEYGLKSTYYLRSQSPDAKKAEETIDRSIECMGCQ